MINLTKKCNDDVESRVDTIERDSNQNTVLFQGNS